MDPLRDKPHVGGVLLYALTMMELFLEQISFKEVGEKEVEEDGRLVDVCRRRKGLPLSIAKLLYLL